tara:strand:- start:93 stop:344 length:252 start_codon:yes stop_codon:yes gene_type:complete
MKVYTEGVFSALMKMIGGGKFRKEMRKIEKITEDDPDLQASIKLLKIQNDEINRKLKNFCKRNPDHDICTGKNPGKSHATVNW